VPMFVDIFAQNKIDLPKITLVIIATSNLITQNFYLILFIIISFLVVAVFFKRHPLFYKYWSVFLSKLPLVNTYFKNVYMAQFAQAMTLLVNSKMGFVESFDLVAKMVRFYPLQKALQKINSDLIKGGSLAESFKAHSIFDYKTLALVKVAEQTNATEFVFEKLHTQFQNQVKNQSQTLTNLLNPILTLLVGLLVGVILVAMYLPMFRLSQVIG